MNWTMLSSGGWAVADAPPTGGSTSVGTVSTGPTSFTPDVASLCLSFERGSSPATSKMGEKGKVTIYLPFTHSFVPRPNYLRVPCGLAEK